MLARIVWLVDTDHNRNSRETAPDGQNRVREGPWCTRFLLSLHSALCRTCWID